MSAADQYRQYVPAPGNHQEAAAGAGSNLFGTSGLALAVLGLVGYWVTAIGILAVLILIPAAILSIFGLYRDRGGYLSVVGLGFAAVGLALCGAYASVFGPLIH
jgi:hypothetical protein